LTVKIESNFGREIVKNISAQWTRIENRHGGGIPDLYGIRDGTSIWLELKCIKQNSINITPTQISWNYNHFQENGKSTLNKKPSNCTTATKGESYFATVSVFRANMKINRHTIGT